MSLRFWLACYPDLTKPIGGIKQIHRCAEALNRLGHSAILIQENADFHPGWFNSSVDTISKKDWDSLSNLDPKCDYIVLPETFLPLALSVAPTIRKIIFNQNGAYSFGLPNRRFRDIRKTLFYYHHPSIAQVWCVSKYDRRLLTTGFGLSSRKVFLLVNPLETSQLSVSSTKSKQIAYMPRKNQHDSAVVLQLLQSKLWLKGWSFKPIQNLSHPDVLCILKESFLFLSFGFPEGFGLPVAEAMACGCATVGYSGLGGRELFRSATDYQLAVSVEYGDWAGFVDGVALILDFFNREPNLYYSNIKALASYVSTYYSAESFESSLLSAINDLPAAKLIL